MHSLGSVDASLKDQLINDFRTANISENDIIILKFAEKITSQPAKIIKDDIIKLKDCGFSESAIHDIAQATAYFNYVNRIADSLGIELESE